MCEVWQPAYAPTWKPRDLTFLRDSGASDTTFQILSLKRTRRGGPSVSRVPRGAASEAPGQTREPAGSSFLNEAAVH